MGRKQKQVFTNAPAVINVLNIIKISKTHKIDWRKLMIELYVFILTLS